MLRSIPITIVLFFIARCCGAQWLPAEGSKLNYLIAGFSVPRDEKATAYVFEIAAANDTDEAVFKKHIIKTVDADTNRIIAELPAFGKQYTWRAGLLNKHHKNIGYTALHHFATLSAPYVDTTQYKLHIIDTAVNYKDRLVLLDFSAVMYNMQGKPVWYLPDVPGMIDRNYPNRDLKPTGTGSFTVLNERGAYEFDYNGKLLWKAPNDGRVSGDSQEHYHHEFTKLGSGHYMVAGMEHLLRKVPPGIDTATFATSDTYRKINDTMYRWMDCSTLIEYDSAGNIVWSLKTAKYFTDDEFFVKAVKGGMYLSDPHLNSFYFDEEKKIIYMGFRNISYILKIKYPSGELLAEYGKYANPGKIRKEGIKFGKSFNAQHCVRVSKEGLLYLFNNNSDHFVSKERSENPTSTVAMFKEPEDSTARGLTKVWEFSCDIDTFASPGSGTGGSVQLLANNNISVCMGLAARAFIVSPEKKIIWNAIPFYKQPGMEKQQIMPLYRIYVLEPGDLEKLIFK